MTHIDSSTSRRPRGRSVDVTSRQRFRRLAGAALVAGAFGLGAGPLSAAGIAHAYTGSCVGPVGAGNILQVREFSLQDVGDGSSLATVEAYAAISESDAQAYIDRPGKDEASFRVWGDDSGSDLLLMHFNPERYWVSPSGLGMRGAAQRPNSQLDEDPGLSSDGRGSTTISPQSDEFYATIRVPDVQNGTTHQVETCRLSLTS